MDNLIAEGKARAFIIVMDTGTYNTARGQAVLNPAGMLFKFYRDPVGPIQRQYFNFR